MKSIPQVKRCLQDQMHEVRTHYYRPQRSSELPFAIALLVGAVALFIAWAVWS